ncbi:accessory gene regulator B family protein [Cellulosilyticum lentocellum]|uniref:Accessory gene regulator B n=1 Tax=Cellulosilyticum lentocellum (strain ATCC 49066 / DSM 5427 / NCIMB 11756 / RHM5) TaxID=642492 RepID=F2JNZ7_CELLD|nr:accessory gene regulator B family protein [Cellulosilyticum lentocellum]ADZ83611.1 Accessory gene regulator B [Cellulosilyticum lentocellum DSM 5427]
MLQIICNRISNKLVLYNIIEKEEQCIYDYGIYLTLMTIITTSTIIVLGFLWGEIGLTIVFLLVLASMRHYTGGYHANHYWQCYLLSCMSYCTVMYLVVNNMLLNSVVLVVLGGGAMIYNLVVGSLNSDKNPKTSKEMLQRTKKARFIFVLYDIVSIVGVLFHLGEVGIWLIIIWSQIIVMFSLLIFQIQRRYFKWKLKKQC